MFIDEVDTTATCLHWSIQQYCRNGGTTEGFGTYHSNIYPGKMWGVFQALNIFNDS